MEEALGTVCWWGLSPAIDLRLHLPPGTEEAAALLVGAAEGRHILLTAARARRGPPRDVTIFVSERRPESIARQLLFLLLATENPGCTSPAARAASILELLGSVRLRVGTAAALPGAAARLRCWVTGNGDGEGPAELELMKCRDRDALECVLRRWEQPGLEPGSRVESEAEPRPGLEPGSKAERRGWERPGLEPGSKAERLGWEQPGLEPWSPAQPREWERPGLEPGSPAQPREWERRLRRLLGTRYEARAAVADWDLRMGLHDRGATSVSPDEFGRWRESGVAFVPRGGDKVGNPTLRSSRCPRNDGQDGPDPGYWGDMVTGPFVAFGLDPERRSPRKSATEISMENVTAMVNELLNGETPGEPPGESHGESPRESPSQWEPPGDHRDPLGPRLPFRLRFLPLGGARRPPPRAHLNPQLLVLGWRSLPELTPQLGQWAAPGATLLVELPTFVPTLRPPQIDAFRARVVALARASRFEPWGGAGEPPAYARFRRAPPP